MPDARSRTTGRLHWPVATASRTHQLDIAPRFGGRASISVDGRHVAESPAPSRRRPWIETDIPLDGRVVTVALGGMPPWLETDVFVDGVSLLDGRTLVDARAGAPESISRFEHWIGGPMTGISTTRLVPPLLLVVALVSLAGMALGLLALRSGGSAALLAGLGMLGWGFAVVIRTYAVGMAKLAAWLVRRGDLGDVTRIGILVLAAAVGWFASLGLFFVPILILALVQAMMD